MSLSILAPGRRTTVQDRGRPGHADLGVGRAGAADLPALELANRILGNDERAAGLEMTLGGLQVRSGRSTWMCVTGPLVDVFVDETPVGVRTAFYVPAGSTVRVGEPARGMRNYLGVRGGIDVPELLGSRSTDTLGGIGPEPLSTGTVLPVGALPAEPLAGLDVVPAAEPLEVAELLVDPGPRADWFTADAWPMLLRTSYVVTADSDRIGVRLDGPPLPRARDDELPSEGLMQGAVQIPPIGTPVCFLADTPTTGGYPVLAVVRRRSLPALAQVRPGQAVRFRAG